MAATKWLDLLRDNSELQVQVFQYADNAGLCWPSISGPGNITSTAFYWLKEAHPDTKGWEVDSSLNGKSTKVTSQKNRARRPYLENTVSPASPWRRRKRTNPLTHPTLKLIRLSTSVFYDNSLPFKPIRIAVFATCSKSILTETNSY